MKPPKLPGDTLTVVIRDDSPLIHTNDNPSYRSVQIKLTEEQRQKIRLKWIGKSIDDMYEAISQAFIEPKEEQES